MNFRLGNFVCGFIGPIYGLAWMRFGGDNAKGWQVKAPWREPLYSERSGRDLPALRVLGFRIFRLRPYGIFPEREP